MGNPPIDRAQLLAMMSTGPQPDGPPLEAHLVMRYGKPYWAVLFMPPGGFSVSGNVGPLRLEYGIAVAEIDADTGEFSAGFSMNLLPS